jgi:hypothetical protein
MAIRPIISRLDYDWQQFATDIKMTYLSLLTRGPLVKLPWAMDFSD